MDYANCRELLSSLVGIDEFSIFFTFAFPPNRKKITEFCLIYVPSGLELLKVENVSLFPPLFHLRIHISRITVLDVFWLMFISIAKYIQSKRHKLKYKTEIESGKLFFPSKWVSVGKLSHALFQRSDKVVCVRTCVDFWLKIERNFAKRCASAVHCLGDFWFFFCL